jgi:hypothetical protein
MRLYSFVNGLYLNRLQCGIQTGHAAVDLARSGQPTAEDWADNHKTFIILDARNYAGLKKVESRLEHLLRMYSVMGKVNYPITSFHEDGDSLNGILTCVAAVIPSAVYELDTGLTNKECTKVTEDHFYGVEHFHAMSHSTLVYQNLLACFLQQYHLVSV